MNINISGVIKRLGKKEEFEWNGAVYHCQNVMIRDTKEDNFSSDVIVRFNTDKFNMETVQVGNYIELSCYIKSRISDKGYVNTNLSVSRFLNEPYPVTQEQKVEQKVEQKQEIKEEKKIEKKNIKKEEIEEDLPF